MLSVYDIWVLGISNQYIWKCSTVKLLSHFNNNVSSNHLDIGVGTGYFLDKCHFPSTRIRLALMDLNQNSLDGASHRVKRYNPVKYKLYILDKIELDVKPFDSISLNYLFHCLPGKLSEKLVVLANINHLLSETGTIFGSTILSHGVIRGGAGKKLMSIYNKKGVFSNSEDSLEDLDVFLSSKYSDFKIEVQGCVAIFRATGKCS